MLLAFGISLLEMADSATSTACFMLGSGLMFAAGLRAVRKRPGWVHALCGGNRSRWGAHAYSSGGESVATGALGRKSNLSGRTEIWAAVISAAA
jgi:hypothetical protein